MALEGRFLYGHLMSAHQLSDRKRQRAGRDPAAEHKGLFHQPLLKGHAFACYPHN